MKIETQIKRCKRDWRKLLVALKSEIADDYRVDEWDDSDKPGMLVTIGFTPANPEHGEAAAHSWGYQTGDNSFTGGAYGHPRWAVISLYRDSNCAELANQIESELLELIDEN